MEEKTDNKNDSDLLGEIYRGAKMGVETLDTLMPKVEDAKMKDELIREQKQFRKFEDKALDELHSHNMSPKSINKMQVKMAHMGIQMNTAVDTSPSHIADMLIQGNNMGIIGITKSRNKHSGANDNLTSLADELVNIQQDNIKHLKPFLQ